MQRPEVTDKMIVDMVLDGHTGVEIADKFGFTDATVIYRVKRATGKKPSDLRREHGWGGTNIPPSEVERILKMYESDESSNDGVPYKRPTLASVARETGHAPETIKQVLQKSGINVEPGPRSLFSYTQKQQIVELYQSGVSCPRLAEQFNVNEITIRRTLKAMGVPRRPRGRPPVGNGTPTTP